MAIELKELLEALPFLLQKQENKPYFLESQLIGKYVVVRAYSAGVHSGYLEAKQGAECRLSQSRRHHYFAAHVKNGKPIEGGCSAIALHGSADGSRVSAPLATHELVGVIEVIECTKVAEESIKAAPVWTT